MKTLQNVLDFINECGYSRRQFESEAGMANGTLSAALKAKQELSSRNIKKIVAKFGPHFLTMGYVIIDLNYLGKDEVVILKDDVEEISKFEAASKGTKTLNKANRPAPRGDIFNRERALIKVLVDELAKLQSKVYNRPLEDCLSELENNTIVALNDLNK